MAIYRLSIKIVKEHVSAKVAYIERQGKYSKGTKAEELRESWSENLPSWAANSQDFWRDIETEEKPGQTQARGIELALPRELSPEEQKAIVEEFCNTSLKGHAKTVAIHDSSDGKNPHVHIYFTERRIDDREEPPRGKYCRQRTGYSKAKEINGAGRKQWLVKIRKNWEIIQNKALENAGYLFDQVSCESLEAQGVTREAQIHVGYQDVNRYRKTGEKGVRYRRNEAILSRNRDYISELSAAQADVNRLEKAVKEEKKAKEEAARKAAEAKRKAEEVHKAEAERLRVEAAWRAEAERRRADDARRAEAETAQKAAEAAPKQPEPEPTAPERWLDDETICRIAWEWSNVKRYDHDFEAMKTVVSGVISEKIDFSQIDEKQQNKLYEAAFFVVHGYGRRGTGITKPETARRRFNEILGAARVPEKAIERVPDRVPEQQLERRQKEPEITKTKKKDQNRGWER